MADKGMGMGMGMRITSSHGSVHLSRNFNFPVPTTSQISLNLSAISYSSRQFFLSSPIWSGWCWDWNISSNPKLCSLSLSPSNVWCYRNSTLHPAILKRRSWGAGISTGTIISIQKGCIVLYLEMHDTYVKCNAWSAFISIEYQQPQAWRGSSQ